MSDFIPMHNVRPERVGPEPGILDNYLREIRDTPVLSVEDQGELCAAMLEAELVFRQQIAGVPQVAREVIRILGIGTSATHMEWFASYRGRRFSEIGCRPPGVGQWDVYNTGMMMINMWPRTHNPQCVI